MWYSRYKYTLCPPPGYVAKRRKHGYRYVPSFSEFSVLFMKTDRTKEKQEMKKFSFLCGTAKVWIRIYTGFRIIEKFSSFKTFLNLKIEETRYGIGTGTVHSVN
jgi:hypothetical protein